MTQASLTSLENLTELLSRARKARSNAYAPYSEFNVGAALLSEDGKIYTGCNVENVSFGLTTCAERVALGSALADGQRRFLAVAVIGPRDDTPLTPCGACRQVLREFGPSIIVVTQSADGGLMQTTAGALLPSAFDQDALANGKL